MCPSLRVFMRVMKELTDWTSHQNGIVHGPIEASVSTTQLTCPFGEVTTDGAASRCKGVCTTEGMQVQSAGGKTLTS